MGDPAYDCPVIEGRETRKRGRRKAAEKDPEIDLDLLDPTDPTSEVAQTDGSDEQGELEPPPHTPLPARVEQLSCPATSPTPCPRARCSSPAGAQGAHAGLRRDRRAAHPGARGVRHRRPGHRLHPRAHGHPLRRRARSGGQGREDHRHPEEHLLRRRLRRRPDPEPDPRQVRGRHRDPEHRQGDRLPRRRAPLQQRPQRPPPDGGRPRQGRRGRLRGRQPREDAAPARRRRHRLGQVELHQLDDHLDADAVHARRGADDHGRPQAGRAERLRGHPAPDHADHHQPEEGRRGAAVGRARDGPALRRPGELRVPARRRLQQGRPRGQGAGAGRQRAGARAVPLPAA